MSATLVSSGINTCRRTTQQLSLGNRHARPQNVCNRTKASQSTRDSVGPGGVYGTNNGCGGCTGNAMNSGVSAQSATGPRLGPAPGSRRALVPPQAPYSEPNGDYTKDCWLSIYGWDDNGCRSTTGAGHTVYVCSTNDSHTTRVAPPANPTPYAPPPPVRPPPSSPPAAAGEVCEQGLAMRGWPRLVREFRYRGCGPGTKTLEHQTALPVRPLPRAARRRASCATAELSKRRKAAYQRKKKAHSMPRPSS